MTHLRLQIKRIGPHFRTVLVSGEAGCGKEIVARALHGLSTGANGPFVVCDAREDLAEYRVSGDRPTAAAEYVKGAVTAAQEGTLFFGDIGRMPLEIQAELLRFLRRQETLRSERISAQKMNVRVIASAREDLKVLVSAGLFLHELYQRLAMVEIAVPPLREHREDMAELAMCLVERLSRPYGRSIEHIAGDAIEMLRERRWPGNVRELEDVLQQAVLRCEGRTLEACHLPDLDPDNVVEKTALKEGPIARLQDVVDEHVLHVLKRCSGNKLRAAELLGISRSTLYRMLDGRGYAEAAVPQGTARGERYTG